MKCPICGKRVKVKDGVIVVHFSAFRKKGKWWVLCSASGRKPKDVERPKEWKA